MRRSQRTFRPDNKEDRHTCISVLPDDYLTIPHFLLTVGLHLID